MNGVYCYPGRSASSTHSVITKIVILLRYQLKTSITIVQAQEEVSRQTNWQIRQPTAAKAYNNKMEKNK